MIHSQTDHLLVMQRAKEDKSLLSPATLMQDGYHNFHSWSPTSTSHFWESSLASATKSTCWSISPIVPTQAWSLSASPPHCLFLSKCKAPPSPKTTVGPSKKVKFIKMEAHIFTHLLFWQTQKLIGIEQFKIRLSCGGEITTFSSQITTRKWSSILHGSFY